MDRIHLVVLLLHVAGFCMGAIIDDSAHRDSSNRRAPRSVRRNCYECDVAHREGLEAAIEACEETQKSQMCVNGRSCGMYTTRESAVVDSTGKTVAEWKVHKGCYKKTNCSTNTYIYNTYQTTCCSFHNCNVFPKRMVDPGRLVNPVRLGAKCHQCSIKMTDITVPVLLKAFDACLKGNMCELRPGESCHASVMNEDGAIYMYAGCISRCDTYCEDRIKKGANSCLTPAPCCKTDWCNDPRKNPITPMLKQRLCSACEARGSNMTDLFSNCAMNQHTKTCAAGVRSCYKVVGKFKKRIKATALAPLPQGDCSWKNGSPDGKVGILFYTTSRFKCYRRCLVRSRKFKWINGATSQLSLVNMKQAANHVCNCVENMTSTYEIQFSAYSFPLNATSRDGSVYSCMFPDTDLTNAPPITSFFTLPSGGSGTRELNFGTVDWLIGDPQILPGIPSTGEPDPEPELFDEIGAGNCHPYVNMLGRLGSLSVELFDISSGLSLAACKQNCITTKDCAAIQFGNNLQCKGFKNTFADILWEAVKSSQVPVMGGVKCYLKKVNDDDEPEPTEPGTWIHGHKCPLGRIKTAFRGDLGYDLDRAKAECVNACDKEARCRFASLYFAGSKQTCYLVSSTCGDWKNNKNSAYHLYKKTELAVITQPTTKDVWPPIPAVMPPVPDAMPGAMPPMRPAVMPMMSHITYPALPVEPVKMTFVHPCDEASNGGCDQICTKNGTEAVCTCKERFKKISNTTCQECVWPFCFKSCFFGFTTDKDGCAECNCRKEHLCDSSSKGGCEQKCVKDNDQAKCACDEGFKLKKDEKNCEQVVHPCDEASNGGCKQICTKNGTEAVCTCKVGFRKVGKTTCQVCQSSFCYLPCWNGFATGEDGCAICACKKEHPCDSFSKGGCEHQCIKNNDQAQCACDKGFKLNKDGKKCEKVCKRPMCRMLCHKGMKKDENGCDTCECAPDCNPLLGCDLVCPDGYQRDPAGCTMCKCKHKECPLAMCFKICPHGFKKTKDGCTLCDCQAEALTTLAVPTAPHVYIATDPFIQPPNHPNMCLGKKCQKNEVCLHTDLTIGGKKQSTKYCVAEIDCERAAKEGCKQMLTLGASACETDCDGGFDLGAIKVTGTCGKEECAAPFDSCVEITYKVDGSPKLEKLQSCNIRKMCEMEKMTGLSCKQFEEAYRKKFSFCEFACTEFDANRPQPTTAPPAKLCDAKECDEKSDSCSLASFKMDGVVQTLKQCSTRKICNQLGTVLICSAIVQKGGTNCKVKCDLPFEAVPPPTRAGACLNAWPCLNGKCVPLEAECNGTDDCGDNSDEYCDEPSIHPQPFTGVPCQDCYMTIPCKNGQVKDLNGCKGCECLPDEPASTAPVPTTSSGDMNAALDEYIVLSMGCGDPDPSNLRYCRNNCFRLASTDKQDMLVNCDNHEPCCLGDGCNAGELKVPTSSPMEPSTSKARTTRKPVRIVKQRVSLRFDANCSLALANRARFLTRMRNGLASSLNMSRKQLSEMSVACGSVVVGVTIQSDPETSATSNDSVVSIVSALKNKVESGNMDMDLGDGLVMRATSMKAEPIFVVTQSRDDDNDESIIPILPTDDRGSGSGSGFTGGGVGGGDKEVDQPVSTTTPSTDKTVETTQTPLTTLPSTVEIRKTTVPAAKVKQDTTAPTAKKTPTKKETSTTMQPTPSTQRPTTVEKTTAHPTTNKKSKTKSLNEKATEVKTTSKSITEVKTTNKPTTEVKFTHKPTTEVKFTNKPTTEVKFTNKPTTEVKFTLPPTTKANTTAQPATTTRPPTTKESTTTPATITTASRQSTDPAQRVEIRFDADCAKILANKADFLKRVANVLSARFNLSPQQMSDMDASCGSVIVGVTVASDPSSGSSVTEVVGRMRREVESGKFEMNMGDGKIMRASSFTASVVVVGESTRTATVPTTVMEKTTQQVTTKVQAKLTEAKQTKKPKPNPQPNPQPVPKPGSTSSAIGVRALHIIPMVISMFVVFMQLKD